jgi:hypothetical protein
MATPEAATSLLFGLSPDVVAAIGTVALAVGTVALAIPTIFLAVAAWRQLPLLQGQIKALGEQIADSRAAEAAEQKRQTIARQEMEWRSIEANTLRACERYFSNPVIYQATRAVYTTAVNGTKYDKAAMQACEHELITVLNYLNALAVGVDEGIYSGDIIKDHLPNTIVKVVDTLIPNLIATPVKWQPLLNLRQNRKVSNPSYSRGPSLDKRNERLSRAETAQ